jgi:beta-lactamase regulating signal transducer with metallopeptidase domain
MLQTANGWADGWLKVMAAAGWQSALLVALAALVAWWLRRSSPVVRYWLWQIVAIKLLLMPFWSFAVPLPTWLQRHPSNQSAALHPPNDSAVGSSRAVLPQRFPTPEPAAAGAAPPRPLLGEVLATISWPAWLFLAWLAVVVWQLPALLRQRLRLAGLLRRAVAPDRELAQLVAELAARVGLPHVPTAVCVGGDCPLFVCGLWRPRLVLPSALMASLAPAERRQVILHELAHVKRHDLLWGWTAEIARMVYFFNPLVWWVGYRLRLERELACDQLAMATSGHPPADYAQTLVQVVSHASRPAGAQAAALSAELTGDPSLPKREP